MVAKTAKKIEVFNGDDSALSILQGPITATFPKLPVEFEECWASIEGVNDNFDEEVLRRSIEGMTDDYLEAPVCEYLRDLVLHNPFFFFSKGLACKLLGDVERRWRHYDKSTVDCANRLRDCILSLIKSYLDCAPPKMRLRVRIELWQKPQPIPAHNTAPAVGFSIDAATGGIYQRFYGTNMPVPVSPIIACGLTILCQPFRYGDEAWTQESGQGGDMFSEERTMLTNERTDRVLQAVSPKPRPV